MKSPSALADVRKIVTKPVPCRMCARGQMYHRLKDIDISGRRVYRCDTCSYTMAWSNGTQRGKKTRHTFRYREAS